MGGLPVPFLRAEDDEVDQRLPQEVTAPPLLRLFHQVGEPLLRRRGVAAPGGDPPLHQKELGAGVVLLRQAQALDVALELLGQLLGPGEVPGVDVVLRQVPQDEQ